MGRYLIIPNTNFTTNAVKAVSFVFESPMIEISNNGVVIITHSDSNAVIYFTTDGSTPTTSSMQYTTSFTVIAGTIVKAIAVKNGRASGVISATYSGIYTLHQGYASVGTSTILSVSENQNAVVKRVRTNVIAGSYRVKTKAGYVIRSIATFSNDLGDIENNHQYTITDGRQVSVSDSDTDYILNNNNRYSVITFCKTDPDAQLIYTEDIVESITPV